MSGENRAWTWPSISAGVFIGAVGAFIGGLFVAIVSNVLFSTKTDSDPSPTSAVTVEPPPATVTVTVCPSGAPSEKPTVTPTASPSSGGSELGVAGESSPDDILLLAPLRPADGYRSGRGRSYKIGTVLYPHSLSTFCNNSCLDNPKYIEYGISEGYSRFTAKIGIDGDNGSSKQVVTFRVKLIGTSDGNDQTAFEKTISLGGEADVDVSLKGAVRIRLETAYGGSDSKDAVNLSLHPVWGTPALHRK